MKITNFPHKYVTYALLIFFLWTSITKFDQSLRKSKHRKRVAELAKAQMIASQRDMFSHRCFFGKISDVIHGIDR